MSLNVFEVTLVSPTKTDRPSAQGRQPSENGLMGSHSPQTSSAARSGRALARSVGGAKAAPAARASATITRRRCILFFCSRSACERSANVRWGAVCSRLENDARGTTACSEMCVLSYYAHALNGNWSPQGCKQSLLMQNGALPARQSPHDTGDEEHRGRHVFCCSLIIA